MAKELANHEIVTLAVYLLGGESHYVDTEDVAIKANELAPGRFTWQKYREQVNIDTVRKRLWDAKKPEKGGFLVGSEKKGWLLTTNGLNFARDRGPELHHHDLARDRVSLKEKQWRRAERERLLSSTAFQTYQHEGIDAVRKQDAEAFFRLDSYVVGPLRERKLLRLLNTFRDDPDLGELVRVLADKVKGD